MAASIFFTHPIMKGDFIMRRIIKRIKDEIEFRKLLKEWKKIEKEIMYPNSGSWSRNMMGPLTRTRWTK